MPRSAPQELSPADRCAPRLQRRTDMHKNLVIIGGGFAGIKAAQQLEHALPTNWNLTLISQENFITFKPLLPEVVGPSILPGHVIAPHRQMIHCSQVCMAQVTHIHTVEHL
jgi:NADH:ubiquinone reductase (H+-translocating)